MTKPAKQAIGQQILAAFRAAGAVEVAPDILLPAETLLALYGEDIRARAYVTQDPIRGEMMLRPDFTVPVVQMHMRNGAEPARYCYLGEVFRKQDPGCPLSTPCPSYHLPRVTLASLQSDTALLYINQRLTIAHQSLSIIWRLD